MMKTPTTLPGLGIDIVEIDRIHKLALKNRSFLTRIFTSEEIRYCSRKKKKWQHFAVRFAAKEAVWKALGAGFSIKNIFIRNDSQGKPEVHFTGKRNGRPRILVSLTHSDRYAAAVALALK